VTVLPGRACELRLLSLAGETQHAERPAPAAARLPDRELRAAYARCTAISAACSHSFHLATALLPPAKRRAIRTLYAVCRISDNLVDCKQGGAAAALRDWRQRVLAPEAPPGDPILSAWGDVRRRYAIPQRYMEQLLNGVAQDLRPPRLATFDDLAAYAYGVASTVGLMSMHVLGYTSDDARPYAIKLGVALQLTNILRDVGDDWRAGRVYLPRTELEQFGLADSAVAAGRVDERWRSFMRFQIDRNRRLYAEAWPGLRMLHPDGRLAVAAAADLYRAILAEIEALDYDVFSRRAHVSLIGKLCRLPGLWRQCRSGCRPTTM